MGFLTTIFKTEHTPCPVIPRILTHKHLLILILQLMVLLLQLPMEEAHPVLIPLITVCLLIQYPIRQQLEYKEVPQIPNPIL